MAKTRVLIVDDSSFIRRILSDIISENHHLEVIGTASNGREAILLAKTLAPDVITMDIEMPVMDGITAVKEIMATNPTPILMFSSLTKIGAKATLEALEAGALDFLSKSLTDISSDTNLAKRQLCARIRVLGARGLQEPFTQADTTIKSKVSIKKSYNEENISKIDDFNIKNYKYLLVGTSTGGPAALQEILTKLPANYPVPIVIIQHMPESFTGPFAERLNSLSNITVKLAHNGDVLTAGTAYIAPGGHQLRFNNVRDKVSILVDPAENQDTYKPSVDTTFSSAADQQLSNILAIILTGMGNDGLKGVKKLKKNNMTTIWSQDKESSIVYGMPMSINQEGLADKILSLTQISNALASGV